MIGSSAIVSGARRLHGRLFCSFALTWLRGQLPAVVGRPHRSIVLFVARKRASRSTSVARSVDLTTAPLIRDLEPPK